MQDCELLQLFICQGRDKMYTVVTVIPKATATSSCCSDHNQHRQRAHLQRAVLALWLVEHLWNLQRFVHYSHTNFIKVDKFFLRPQEPSHLRSVQTTSVITSKSVSLLKQLHLALCVHGVMWAVAPCQRPEERRKRECISLENKLKLGDTCNCKGLQCD